MRYRTQWIAYPYFVVAMLLFGLQMVFGLLAAAKYLGPDPLLSFAPRGAGRSPSDPRSRHSRRASRRSSGSSARSSTLDLSTRRESSRSAPGRSVPEPGRASE